MPSILDGSVGSAVSLLNAGRNLFGRFGIGLSASARALNEQFISANKIGYNGLFALGAGPSISVEGAQTAIKALRAKTPQSQLAPSLQTDDNADNGNAAASTTRGTGVDTAA